MARKQVKITAGKHEEVRQSTRIQTSLFNAAEKKILVAIAKKLPKWVTSDMLTLVGVLGAIVIAIGYIHSNVNIQWLWLASLGFVINWFGDSLDGTVARVRGTQRPIYGYYVDHITDVFNEAIIFIGAGFSILIDIRVALILLVLYLMLTINVSINAHLKNEFKLTYMGLGPTEFRILMIIINTLFIYIRPLREYTHNWLINGVSITFTIFDYIAMVIGTILLAIIIVNCFRDARGYAAIDPLPEAKEEDNTAK